MSKKAGAPKWAKKLFIFLTVIFVFLFKAGKALALELYYPTLNIFGTPISINDTSTLPEYARYFFTIGIALAGFVAVIAVAIGGVYYLVDYATGKFVSEGKEWIKAGLIGLLLIVCAYVILDTINPNLVIFQIPGLPPISLFNPIGSSPSPNIDFSNYEEIPIGVLTENVLSRTMDCYAFDPMGNPIDGNQITTDDGQKINGPTFLDHDRADCLAQLMDGAQKKAQVISELSDAITKLMNTCKCSGDICSNNCDANGDGCTLSTNGLSEGVNEDCMGQCGGACAQNTPNTTLHTDPITGQQSWVTTYTPNPSAACQPINQGSDCCPAGVKDQIEHGPVVMGGGANCNPNGGNNAFNNKQFNLATASLSNSFLLAALLPNANGAANNNVNGGAGGNANAGNNTCCDLPSTTFNGLDEFRCPNPNNTSTPSCDSASAIVSFVETQVQLNKQTINIVDQKKWAELNLIQQLTYFKGKISDLEQKIQQDGNVLNQAKATLGQCYLAIPSIDLFKIYQTTDQNVNFISTQKVFSDPVTNNPIDSSKYCEGFNYNNSSCLKTCNDQCPDTSQQAITTYKNCNQNCKAGDQQCLSTQETCIENAYNNRPCLYAPDNSTGTGSNGQEVFKDCITSCQNDCSNICSQKYLPCSADFGYCQSECGNNSQCVLNNESKCLFDGQNGAQGFVNCASQGSDQGNTDYCINNNAYTCKNGSSQYAGYTDCANSQDTTSGTNCSSDTDCSGSEYCSSDGYCVQDYSASFFYQNPDAQKCPKPFGSPTKNSVCYSATRGNASCQQLCPETNKCPVSSKCPDCPCDQTPQALQNLTFPVASSAFEFNGQASTQEPTVIQTKVLAYQIVGPQCNEYSYNGDPLTFYCENSWWKDPLREGQNNIPIGGQESCSKSQEIPVGQTVDDAEDWASSIINIASNESNYIQGTINLMEQIGNAQDNPTIQNYCRCNAKTAANNPICTTNCQFNSELNLVPIIVNGNQIGADWELDCNCQVTPCDGNPCQQMINYLWQTWIYFKQLKTNYVGFYSSMLQDPRSDIMKELTYSRQLTTSSNVTQNNFGNQSRMLDCTRAEDEKIPDILQSGVIYNGQKTNNYCYGIALGKLYNKSLTDNWFWCNLQKINNNPAK